MARLLKFSSCRHSSTSHWRSGISEEPEALDLAALVKLVKKQGADLSAHRRRAKEAMKSGSAILRDWSQQRGAEMLASRNKLAENTVCSWNGLRHTCPGFVACCGAEQVIEASPRPSSVQSIADEWTKRHFAVPAEARSRVKIVQRPCLASGTCTCTRPMAPHRRFRAWLKDKLSVWINNNRAKKIFTSGCMVLAWATFSSSVEDTNLIFTPSFGIPTPLEAHLLSVPAIWKGCD